MVDNKPIKVLLAIDEFRGPIAGTESQYWKLLELLSESAGVAPGALVLRHSPLIESQLPEIAYRSLGVVRLASPRSVWQALSAAYWARRNGFSILHTFLNDVSILLPWPMRLFGIRVVVSRRDEGFWYTRGKLRVLKMNRPAVARVATNSTAVAMAVMKHEKYQPSKIAMIPNIVDLFDVAMSKKRARIELQIPRNALVFAIIANLRPLKRIDDAIRALAEFRTMEGNGILLIAGRDDHGRNGPSHQRELEQIATDYGISGSVIFMGSVERPESVLAAADIGLSCSETEGLSNSVLEFMAAGRPVIASDIEPNRSVIEDSVTGFLFKTGKCSELASQMRHVVHLQQSIVSITSAAKHLVEEKYSPASMERHIHRVYSEIVGTDNALDTT